MIRNQGVMRSPYSGATTVIDNFAEWEFVLGFPPVSSTGAKPFLAWFNSLQGAIGTFTYTPHGAGKAITGKTVYSTGFAYANSIIVTGWSAGAATGLVAGDWFTLSSKLFQITAVGANADGSGHATITFEPSLRANVASTTAVNFATPTVVLRVQTDNKAGGGGSSLGPDGIAFDALTATEAL